MDQSNARKYVTYMSNDRDVIGVCVLNYSLKKHKCKHQLVCVISERVSEGAVQKLQSYNIPTVLINERDLYKSIGLTDVDDILDKGWFGKLNIFGISQKIEGLEKIVFIDADTLVLKNIDHLFDVPCQDMQLHMTLDAFSDVKFTNYYLTNDKFNSGVFISMPNQPLFELMINTLVNEIKQDTLGRDDQHIFNLLNKNGSIKIEQLSLRYNMPPALHRVVDMYGFDDVHIYHYIGHDKPYLNNGILPYGDSEIYCRAYFAWHLCYNEMIKQDKKKPNLYIVKEMKPTHQIFHIKHEENEVSMKFLVNEIPH